MKKLVLGSFQTNCYIIENDKKEVFIVDPGDNGKKINKYLEDNDYKLKAIMITHGHIDHIHAVEYLYNIYKCPVYAHQDTIEIAQDSFLNLSATMSTPYVLDIPMIPASDEFEVIGYKIRWYFLPGHCKGSSMIYLVNKNIMFSGDVLFKGSIGRYDFPTSSHFDTKKTLEVIKEMDLHCDIYPGHGEATTLDEEKQNNYYLR